MIKRVKDYLNEVNAPAIAHIHWRLARDRRVGDDIKSAHLLDALTLAWSDGNKSVKPPCLFDELYQRRASWLGQIAPECEWAEMGVLHSRLTSAPRHQATLDLYYWLVDAYAKRKPMENLPSWAQRAIKVLDLSVALTDRKAKLLKAVSLAKQADAPTDELCAEYEKTEQKLNELPVWARYVPEFH